VDLNLDQLGSALFLEAGPESGSALKSKFKSFRGLKYSREWPWTLTMEAWRFKMEPWRVYRPVVADSHYFAEELDPDPHYSKKLDPDPDQDRHQHDANPQHWF
jgi:hypothetical protein